MRRYELHEFGAGNLRLGTAADPEPGPGEIVLAVKAMSLNYRDVAVIEGSYNKRLPLPFTPISDAAGVVAAVGEGVTGVQAGDRVMTHFVAGWRDGPFRADYVGTTLGAPGPGVAAERVVLKESAVVPMPRHLDFAAAATLPIAGLTAWSALVTEAAIAPGQLVLTLGTGGVSTFVVQLGHALGARVAVTSSSDDKLAILRGLGADHGINYRSDPDWDKRAWEWSGKRGVDLVVETAGALTLSRSLRAARGGGVIALMGSLSGLIGEVALAPLVMRRLRVVGILVDSRKVFGDFVAFLEQHAIQPLIGARFGFTDLAAALAHMQAGRHVGKVVVEVA